jgi:hypothetical protein
MNESRVRSLESKKQKIDRLAFGLGLMTPDSQTPDYFL